MNQEIVACLSCLAPNDMDADFCEKCGAPISATSTLDPLKMIRSEGFLLSRATTVKKPPLVVLLGIWVIFLPALAGGAALAYSQFSEGFGFDGFLFFWIGIGLIIVSTVILYRVTKNYSSIEVNPNEEDQPGN